jgi:hypothetical protein
MAYQMMATHTPIDGRSVCLSVFTGLLGPSQPVRWARRPVWIALCNVRTLEGDCDLLARQRYIADRV